MKNEESLFSTCLVPLQLEVNSETIWKNSSPSSILFCRPIRLQFKTETADTCQQEKSYIESKIERIEYTSHTIAFENFVAKVNVRYDLQLTMLDGKAINAISYNPSTQTCNICLSKPSEMNDIDSLLNRPVINEETAKYGLSVLHCWIRFFEFILHLGYKLDIKKWMARTEEEKRSVQGRKEKIKLEFRKRLHLLVDHPKVGTGNTNDGNTARVAFRNSFVFSEITGVEKEVIDMLHSIIQVINSCHEIDTQKFESYCIKTAKTIVNLYPWYKIPAIQIWFC